MNFEDLRFLIAQGEGFQLEFKESFSDSLGRKICAFANSKGKKLAWHLFPLCSEPYPFAEGV